GYTHLQRAQPIILAHHLLAYGEMFRRDYGRLGDAYHRLDESPLGSGALAGTTFPLDRAYVAHELGFSRITRNSLDAVSDRDFALEFLAALAVLSVHLSRLAEELVLWSSQEFRFVIFDDAYATGSSMMPQKKNPDTAELVRGKTGRIIGHLVSLLVVLKGLPLAYNKDLQEDKEALFDAYDTAIACLRILEGIMRTLIFQPERMREATRAGDLTATDLADYLAARDIPFREAHGMVSRAVRYAEEHNCLLEDIPLAQLQELLGFSDEHLLDMLNIDQAVARRNVPGGTSPLQVEYALLEARAWLTQEQSAGGITSSAFPEDR
ncbi:MAG: argininosuccinate lyase, partial [Chloroflexi bacterium]|nr:argininosuccinate lyase [Chloroflexota bacterium]